MRVGRLQTLLDVIADEAELIHLVAAVEPLPTVATGRNDLLIPVLPGAQRLCRHAEHASYGPDAVDAAGTVRAIFHPAPPPSRTKRELEVAIRPSAFLRHRCEILADIRGTSLSIVYAIVVR